MRWIFKISRDPQTQSIEDQEFDHTIKISADIPIGTEFEAYPLYGLGKSEFDALRSNSLLNFQFIKYSLSALVGLFLPDAFKYFQTKQSVAAALREKIEFAAWIVGIAIFVEIVAYIFQRVLPLTEKYRAIKSISDHFKKNTPRRARSK